MISLVLHEYDLNERENFYNKNAPKYNIKVSATQDSAEDIISKSDNIEKITVANENLNLNLNGEDLNYSVYDKDNYKDVLKIDVVTGRMPENNNEIIVPVNILSQFPNMEVSNNIIGSIEEITYDKEAIMDMRIMLQPSDGMANLVDYSEVRTGLSENSKFVFNEEYGDEGKVEFSKKVINKNKEFKIVGAYINKIESKKINKGIITLDSKENILKTNTVRTYYCDYNLGSKSVQEISWRGVRYDSQMYLESLKMANEINSSETGMCSATPQDKNEVRNALEVTAFIAELSPITIAIFIGFFTIMAMTNAFNMAINERIKQIGTLKALGASPIQIWKMIVYEIIIMILISFPIGILLGRISSELIIALLKNNYGYGEYLISTSAYFKMGLICLGTIIIAVFLSSNSSRYKAKKLTAIEAMTSSTMYNKGEITADNSKFINKHFGIEVILADKDVSCNAEKYRMCFVSLALGIIFLMFMVNKTIRIGSTGNYKLKSNNWNIEMKSALGYFNDNNIQDIKKIIGDEKLYINSTEQNLMKLPKDKVNKEIEENIGDFEVNNTKVQMLSTNMIYGDEDIFNLSKKNLISGEIDYKNFKENDIILINSGYIFTEDDPGKPKYMESITNCKVGDKITTEDGKEYNIAAIISENPLNDIQDNKDEEEMQMSSNISIISSYKYKQVPIKSIYLDINGENRNSIVENLNNMALNKQFQVKDYKEAKDNINVLNKRYTILDVIFTMSLVIIVLLNLINTLNLVTLTRKGELAALRAIGMNKSQLKRHLISEGMIICFYSICISLLIGGTLMMMTNSSIRYVSSESILIIIAIVAGIVVLQLLIGIISTLLPLRKMLKLSIADEMRV